MIRHHLLSRAWPLLPRFALCLLLLTPSPARAQDASVAEATERPQTNRTFLAGKPAGDGRKVRLFILAGQSNMGGLNPEMSFIPALEAAFPDDALIVVKRANAGQPIHKWYKGWAFPEGEANTRAGNIYDLHMADIAAAVGDRMLDSVSLVWMQGESDGKGSRGGESGQYAAALRGLIKQWRDDLKRPDMTVVVGRINRYMAGDPHWDEVRAAQVSVTEADPLADWVDLDGLPGGLHYQPDGYTAMGNAFAEKTIALIQKED